MIKNVEDGEDYNVIGKRYNIGISTIKDIFSRKTKIQEMVEKNRLFGISTKKVLKEAKKPLLEEELYAMIVQKSDKGIAVTNKDLMKYASSLNLKIYNEAWTPSKGWLEKFKSRYSLHAKSSNSIVKDEDYSLIIEDKEIESNGNETEVATTNINSSEIIDDDNEEKSEAAGSSVCNKVSKINVLSAADILLDFVNEHDFLPLKEVITLRIIRDKISQMAEANTIYEVVQPAGNEEQEEEVYEEEMFLKCEEGDDEINSK